MRCRGQAHIAFRDVVSATQAMRALHGVNVYGKDMVCGSSESFCFYLLYSLHLVVKEHKQTGDQS